MSTVAQERTRPQPPRAGLADPVAALAAFAIELGVDAQVVANALGISLATLIAPQKRLPDSLMPPLWRLLRATFPGRPIPLEMAERVPLTMMGMVAEVATYAPTLQHALDVFGQHAPLLSTNLRFHVEDVPGGLRVALIHGNDALDGGMGGDLAMAISVRMLREYLNFPNAVLRVEFDHEPIGPRSRYNQFFRLPLRFGATYNAIVYRRSSLSFPISGASDARFKAALPHLSYLCEQVVQNQEPDSLRRIRHAIGAKRCLWGLSS